MENEFNISVVTSWRDGEYYTLSFDYLNALALALNLIATTTVLELI